MASTPKLDTLQNRDATHEALQRNESFRDAMLGAGRSISGVIDAKYDVGTGDRNPGIELMHGDYHANSHQDNSSGGGHGDSHVDEHNDSN